MNKEWVHLNRTTNEYLIGRRAFISNALDVAAFQGKIKCPCRSCCNMFYRGPFEVDQHLYVEGMDPHYIDIPWVEHGEQVHTSHNISSPTTEALNERSPENFMQAMLHDVFSNHVHMDESDHVGESSSACDETTDAHQFDNILREADGELYPGSRKKRLDFVVKLYQSKLLYGMSDAAFGSVLALIREHFPMCETLPPNLYYTKKIIRALGLDYHNIDVCPNNCMLFWKEHVNAIVCAKCGASRYKQRKGNSRTIQCTKRRCATNAKNRKMLKTSHTTGTTTFAQIRNDYAEEHDGSEPDRVTFFKMTHTRGPQQLPIDAESARMMLSFENLEVEVRERGEEVTTEVRNRIYAEVMGPEKRNQVRGFGLGVGWADVPGIITEQRSISREVKYLREAYEAQKQATAAAEEKMTRMMHEANEKAEKMKKEQEESIQRLRAEQEENLRLAKVQMAEQFKAMLAHVGINIGSFGVGALQSTSTQQQGCGSSHTQISTLFEGGNDKNVQCGPPDCSALMHEDCQSENTG